MNRILAVLFLAGSASLALADPGYPVTLQDTSGYRLTLDAPPKAIVSLTLTTDEILSELVDKGRLKAIDVFAADPGISNIADFAKTVPRRISAEKETILALSPDLVFVAHWKDKEFVQSLRDAKVPVFVLRDPSNFDELKTAVNQVAALVGEAAKGRGLNASVDRRLAAVAAQIPKGPQATVLSYAFNGATYAKGTSFDALVEKAGLVNAATQAGLTGWPQLSKEKVLELDPDLILLPSWSYDGKANPQKFLTDFLADPVFSSLKAVRQKRVFILQDRHMLSTSQYMVAGVEDLARAAYPAQFR